MIEIDGSYLEGGGQILRTACALSAASRRPCRIFNVRKVRSRPGLMPQHLAGIETLARFCGGNLKGGSLGSSEVFFYPGDRHAEELEVTIKTAGSITLVLQTLTLPAMMGKTPVTVKFRGGATDTYYSPSSDYFREVFLDIIGRIGGRAEMHILKRGYYPRGGAEVQVRIYPSSLSCVELTEKGSQQVIKILSGASVSLKNRNVAERQVAGARELLKGLGIPLEEEVKYYETLSPGSNICLAARYANTVIGSDNLGKQGRKAEDVGKEAALDFLGELKPGACLDRHMADQILPFMAAAGEESTVSVSDITDHCRTNMWVIEHFVDGKFEVLENVITWKPG